MGRFRSAFAVVVIVAQMRHAEIYERSERGANRRVFGCQKSRRSLSSGRMRREAERCCPGLVNRAQPEARGGGAACRSRQTITTSSNFYTELWLDHGMTVSCDHDTANFRISANSEFESFKMSKNSISMMAAPALDPDADDCDDSSNSASGSSPLHPKCP